MDREAWHAIVHGIPRQLDMTEQLYIYTYAYICLCACVYIYMYIHTVLLSHKRKNEILPFEVA